MPTIERKMGSFKDLAFTVNLAAIGKSHTDVEDIICVIKNNISDADTDAIRITRMIDGNSIDANNKVLIPWAFDEYTGFQGGRGYKLGVFCKFTGDPVADEDVKQVFDLKMIPEMLKDE